MLELVGKIKMYFVLVFIVIVKYLKGFGVKFLLLLDMMIKVCDFLDNFLFM